MLAWGAMIATAAITHMQLSVVWAIPASLQCCHGACPSRTQPLSICKWYSILYTLSACIVGKNGLTVVYTAYSNFVYLGRISMRCGIPILAQTNVAPTTCRVGCHRTAE